MRMLREEGIWAGRIARMVRAGGVKTDHYAIQRMALAASWGRQRAGWSASDRQLNLADIVRTHRDTPDVRRFVMEARYSWW